MFNFVEIFIADIVPVDDLDGNAIKNSVPVIIFLFLLGPTPLS